MNTTTTTTTTIPTLRVPAPEYRNLRTRHHGVAALPAAIRSEWIKLRSLRSTPAILAVTFVIGVLLSWILATFVKTDPNTDEVFTVGQTFIFSTWLTTVLAAIMGTLAFTSEVQHGTLAPAVIAQPTRWVIVAAKAAIASGLGLVMGIIGMAAGLLGAVLGGLEAGDTSGVLATASWGLLLTTLAPLFGLGVGMILKHGAMAISTVLVWALVLENLIRGFAPPTLSRFLPFSAANGLLGIRSAGDTDETVAAALSRVHDAFLFGGYVIVALTVGTLLFSRRDPS
jgi:ABC-2 type transport system permease protein